MFGVSAMILMGTIENAARASELSARRKATIREATRRPAPAAWSGAGGTASLLVADVQALTVVGVGEPVPRLAARHVVEHLRRREALELRPLLGRVGRHDMEAGRGEQRFQIEGALSRRFPQEEQAPSRIATRR